jgi:starvation-inducible DNA-binding protein
MATHTRSNTQAGTAQPQLATKARTTQQMGTLIELPIGIPQEVREQSVAILNQVLADTIMLRDFYKKCHWQVAGPQFYHLHLLFDKHYEEQAVLVDAVAERIQILGGLAAGMPHEVAEHTQLPTPSAGREDVTTQISHLAESHRFLCVSCREYATQLGDLGDAGSEDLLVSQILRTNEMQAWFVVQHLSPHTGPSSEKDSPPPR